MPDPQVRDPSERPGALARLRRAIERFSPLPDDVWDDVSRPWRVQGVRRGDFFTLEGDVEDRFGLVLEGAQRAYFTAPGGREHTVAFMYPPDFTGVPDSFFLGTPSGYTIQALTDGHVLVTDRARFMALVERHREVERWTWTMFAHAAAGRAKREREALALSAEERYARLLRESPHVLALSPLRHVASYLGVTPETLSRVRSGGS